MIFVSNMGFQEVGSSLSDVVVVVVVVEAYPRV